MPGTRTSRLNPLGQREQRYSILALNRFAQWLAVRVPWGQARTPSFLSFSALFGVQLCEVVMGISQLCDSDTLPQEAWDRGRSGTSGQRVLPCPSLPKRTLKTQGRGIALTSRKPLGRGRDFWREEERLWCCQDLRPLSTPAQDSWACAAVGRGPWGASLREDLRLLALERPSLFPGNPHLFLRSPRVTCSLSRKTDPGPGWPVPPPGFLVLP